jgi:hypothetical protein
MFDKYKERWAKLEADHESLRKIRVHFEENGKVYLVGAGCLGAGYLLHRPQVITMEGSAPVFNNTVAPVISPIMQNVVENAVSNGGYTRKIIRCLETDQMWPSMKAAAEATGNTLHKMSRHCNGYFDDLQGMHYVIEGLAAG